MKKELDVNNVMEKVQAYAKELGLGEYDQYTINGAGGLIIAHGTSFQDGVYREVIKRFLFDGTPFQPEVLSKEERQEWVKRLKQCNLTQIEMAKFLDVSQSLINRDLKELGLR
jgi:hypothetical protein